MSDLGGKSEGLAEASSEFPGQRRVTRPLNRGMKVEMRVASIRDGIHLTKGMKALGPDSLDILREAKRKPYPY